MGHAFLARAMNGWVYAVEMQIYKLGLMERVTRCPCPLTEPLSRCNDVLPSPFPLPLHPFPYSVITSPNTTPTTVSLPRGVDEALIYVCPPQALSYFSLSFLHRAFDGWLDSVQQRREQMALALQAARKLLHSRAHAAFQGWVHRVNETARQLEVVDRCGGPCYHRSLWFCPLALGRPCGELIILPLDNRCFKRIRNKELSAAFNGWSRAAYERQIARGKVAANVAKIVGSMYLAAWNAWIAFKEASRAAEAKPMKEREGGGLLDACHSSLFCHT